MDSLVEPDLFLPRWGDSTGTSARYNRPDSKSNTLAKAQVVDSFLRRSLGPYMLTDDPALLDLHAMHAYLQRSYWAEQIPLEVLERAVRGSLCIGAYDANHAQIGL